MEGALGLCCIQVWRCGDAGWQLESTLTGHSDWVRDAAWAPNLGLPLNTIASAGQDGQVGSWCCFQDIDIVTALGLFLLWG